MLTRIALAVIFSLPLLAQADYIKVKLSVTAPKNWLESINDNLTTKLNAIPDVQVVDAKDENSSFTIFVDVNNVTNKDDETLGYSMMALILGTYDQKVLEAAFTEGKKNVVAKDEQAWMDILKYSASGNVFLAGWIHTHGPLNAISEQYDAIVGTLKTKGLPEYRKFLSMVTKAIQQSNTTKPMPVTS